MATRQQLEQQLVAAHRSGNVQAAQQAAYAIRAYDQNVLSAQVPSINAPLPVEQVPKPTFGNWLENLSIGAGEYLGEQAQNAGQMVERGVSALDAYRKEPLKASAAAFMTALQPAMQGFTQPVQTAKDIGAGLIEQGREMYREATSGPVGLGRVAASLIDLPGSSQRRPTTHGISEKPKKTRASKAENIERGLYHPIGEGKKLEKPVSEMQFTQEVIKDLPERQIISPESLRGATIIPATGDRTAAGKLLTSIEGVQLPNPVKLEGGPDFMRTHLPHGAAWASDKGVISGLSKKVQEAAKSGSGDVYMIYTPMSHVGGDFSTMMSDALLEQIKGGKITKKAKKNFDQEVRRFRPEWKGVDDPEARAQLNENGALRHAFIDRMTLDQFKTAGFPDLPTTRAAITEQSLMDAPIHAGGFSIAKMDPSGRIIANPVAPHTTYNTQLAGQYVGGFEKPIPRELLYSDFTSVRRAAGTDPAGDMRSFQLSNPVQQATQQWVDNLMRFIESTRGQP